MIHFMGWYGNVPYFWQYKSWLDIAKHISMVGILYINMLIPTINILYRPFSTGLIYGIRTSNLHPILEMAIKYVAHGLGAVSSLRLLGKR